MKPVKKQAPPRSVGDGMASVAFTVVEPRRLPAAISPAEVVLVVAAFTILLGTFKVILPGQAVDRVAGSVLFQLVSGAIYISSVLLLLYHGIPRWQLRALPALLPVMSFTALALVSTLWSQAPEATFRRAVALVLSSGFALYLTGRFEARRAMTLLLVAYMLFVAVGFLSAAIPGMGITPGGPYGGAWRGLTGQKNDFGVTNALAVALLPTLLVLGLLRHRTLAIGTALLAFVLLILSQSATALVAAFVSVGVGVALYVLCGGPLAGIRFRTEIRVVLAFIVIVGGVLFVTTAWTTVLEALGRDATLTGRTKLWDWSIAVNHDRWLFGSGYRAFWIDANTKYFFESFAWSKDVDGNLSDSFSGPTHAHSGYVDIWLEFGLVGALLYGLVIVVALAVLSRALSRGAYAIGYMFALMMIFLHVYAVTARSILQQSEDVWFLFLFFYLLTIKESLITRENGVMPTVRARGRLHFARKSSQTITASSQLSSL